MTRTPASWRFIALAGVLFALLWPGTAAAHGEEGLNDTDYRVTVTEQPRLPGVEVREVEAGARLELRNTGDRSVEILGYEREPYAEIRPEGVFVNVNSPASYLNETTDPDARVPAAASPALAPEWDKVSDEPVIRWHDHRAGWMNAQPPPVVTADPSRPHKVLDWDIPLRSGTQLYTVSGTVEWVPPPAAATWWAAALLLAGGLFVATFKPADLRPVAGLVGVLGLAAIADAVGRAVTSAELETGWLAALVVNQSWQLLAGVAGVGAAVYALRRGSAADLALGIAAAALALLSGLSHVSCLSAAITPTPWGGDLTRVLTVAALGAGTGVAVGVLARMRQPGRTTDTAGASTA
ncbi:hypothetical protein [Stackebrandtia nassauensis]|uniref:Uncharacterized protein n=1 Tax=Stackebrandtia nassauensis (strain DSM 44728 / CIP 108903 / NRRL B-16338 / NBRC 102104 / LLR-40K-21) TaxID=446470 RepID=D3PYY0_STANL|nr:hypothetical protein [Stackebrandtia nassauensis]ADD45409.1 hypothetical protein Snas_5779 [Stackebrandtia nassauensis DSM 44728]